VRPRGAHPLVVSKREPNADVGEPQSLNVSPLSRSMSPRRRLLSANVSPKRGLLASPTVYVREPLQLPAPATLSRAGSDRRSLFGCRADYQGIHFPMRPMEVPMLCVMEFISAAMIPIWWVMVLTLAVMTGTDSNVLLSTSN
jgi:hypothetical protein